MTKLITVLALLFSALGHTQVYYQNTESNTILTESQYLKSKQEWIDKGLGLRELYYKDSIRNDSVIRKFSFRLYKGINPYAKLDVLVNKPMPDFFVEKNTGPIIKISDLYGKPVFINFWTTNCLPCIKEIPRLHRLMDKYKEKVTFITITSNSKEKVNEFLKSKNFNFTHFVNAKGLIEKIKVNAYPTNMILDKNGIISFLDGNLFDGNEKDFERMLEQLML